MEHQYKPDIILVPKHYQRTSSVPFGAMLTYLEVKESLKEASTIVAELRLRRCAGFASSCQINRSFFMGSFLAGRILFLVLYARGATFYSNPIDIDKDPLLFIQTVLALSSGVHPALGFDTRFTLGIRGTYDIQLGNMMLNVSRRTFARGVTMRGRGTKVLICKDENGQVFALKDSWLPSNGPNDVVNNDAYISRKPKSMTLTQQQIFGEEDIYHIFHDCCPTRGTEWDYEKYLPGIPILVHTEFATFSQDGSNRRPQDTTKTISQRFSKKKLRLEQRVHIRTVSKTCGVSLPWFCCRRELVGCMMCAVAGEPEMYWGIKIAVKLTVFNRSLQWRIEVFASL